MRRLALVVPFIVTFALAHGAEPVPTVQKAPKIVIDADELNTKYEVRGPLGVQLGEVVTVVGKTIVNLRKSADPLFQVSAVNGRPLENPVTMAYVMAGEVRREELPQDTECELRAYQTGEFQGARLGPPDVPPRSQTIPFEFVTRLAVLQRLKPPELKQPAVKKQPASEEKPSERRATSDDPFAP
jgi:hypothetical protein